MRIIKPFKTPNLGKVHPVSGKRSPGGLLGNSPGGEGNKV